MDRRTFVATGAGGAVLLGTGGMLGADALLGDGPENGPAYGSIPVPEPSGSTTLDNGRRASLYADGRVALFGASLASQYTGVPAVVGRLRNVSGTTIEQVRLDIRFLDDAGESLAGGWVGSDTLAPGEVWRFVVNYPNNDPKNIATARVAGIEVV
jgi:hypothetical protein